MGSHPREREAEKTKPRGERREHVDEGRRPPRSPATTPLRVRAAVPRLRRRGGRAAGRRRCACAPPCRASAGGDLYRRWHRSRAPGGRCRRSGRSPTAGLTTPAPPLSCNGGEIQAWDRIHASVRQRRRSHEEGGGGTSMKGRGRHGRWPRRRCTCAPPCRAYAGGEGGPQAATAAHARHRAAHPPTGTSVDDGAEAARLEDDAVGRAGRQWPG